MASVTMEKKMHTKPLCFYATPAIKAVPRAYTGLLTWEGSVNLVCKLNFFVLRYLLDMTTATKTPAAMTSMMSTTTNAATKPVLTGLLLGESVWLSGSLSVVLVSSLFVVCTGSVVPSSGG